MSSDRDAEASLIEPCWFFHWVLSGMGCPGGRIQRIDALSRVSPCTLWGSAREGSTMRTFIWIAVIALVSAGCSNGGSDGATGESAGPASTGVQSPTTRVFWTDTAVDSASGSSAEVETTGGSVTTQGGPTATVVDAAAADSCEQLADTVPQPAPHPSLALPASGRPSVSDRRPTRGQPGQDEPAKGRCHPFLSDSLR